MDYSAILHSLQDASLFDLYRLRVGIDGLLDQPERQLEVKRRLRPGMDISYFSGRDNKLVEAVLEEVQRTGVYVQDKADGKRWRVPIYTLNLGGVGTDIYSPPGQHRLDKNHLQIGESIGFYDRDRRELYGKIVQLNPKTATVLTAEGVRWRVGYSLLFKVMDGEGQPMPELGLIEGIVVPDEET